MTPSRSVRASAEEGWFVGSLSAAAAAAACTVIVRSQFEDNNMTTGGSLAQKSSSLDLWVRSTHARTAHEAR